MRIHLAVLIASSVVVACSSTSDEGGGSDSGIDASAADVGIVPDVGSDADTSDVLSFEPESLEPWQSNRSCDGTRTSEPASTEPFPGGMYKGPVVPLDPSELSGSSLYVSSSHRGPHNDFEIYDLLVSEGSDLSFIVQGRVGGGEGIYTVTVLLDYATIDADFEWLDAFTGQVLESYTASGGSRAEPEMGAVRVTIPAEAFEPGRTHEVGLGIRMYAQGIGGYVHTTRAAVHYGGFDTTEYPCALPSLGQAPLESEARLYNLAVIGAGEFPIFHEPIENIWRALEDEYLAQIGEEVPVYYSFLSGNESSREAVLVPVNDGVPFGEPRWIKRDPVETDDNQRVDDRGSVLATFDEPGRHDVFFFRFNDPWIRGYDFDTSERTEGTSIREGLFSGSNVLQFRSK